eukprot:4107636-Pyramimonas_sp.AAC.1
MVSRLSTDYSQPSLSIGVHLSSLASLDLESNSGNAHHLSYNIYSANNFPVAALQAESRRPYAVDRRIP